jgi:hypothetical protein
VCSSTLFEDRDAEWRMVNCCVVNWILITVSKGTRDGSSLSSSLSWSPPSSNPPRQNCHWRETSPPIPKVEKLQAQEGATGTGRSPRWFLAWMDFRSFDSDQETARRVGWLWPNPGVKTFAHPGIPSPSPHTSSLPRAVVRSGKLGFPNDLVGGRPLPHLAAFLSSLWRLPSAVKASFCDGWISVPIRPPPSSDSWPRVGIGIQILKDSTEMDPKGKNTKWDRQIPKPQR